MLVRVRIEESEIEHADVECEDVENDSSQVIIANCGPAPNFSIHDYNK